MLPFLVDNIKLFQFESFPDKGLTHFVTGRMGGISEGEYSDFNMGAYCGDEDKSVIENRRRLRKALIGYDKIFIPYQVHENKVCVVDESFMCLSIGEQEQALYGVDAIITDQPNICIGVATADCVPLLLYADNLQVFAAVHAGWRGTVLKIASQVVDIIQQKWGIPPSSIHVGIGPSISPALFEVGDEVGEKFVEAGFDMKQISFRNAATNKLHIDLWKANMQQLVDKGVEQQHIEIARLCTFTNSADFFSARRQGIYSGRMLTGGYLHK